MASRVFSFAAFGLGIDYLFMPVYATALALGILLAAGSHKRFGQVRFVVLGIAFCTGRLRMAKDMRERASSLGGELTIILLFIVMILLSACQGGAPAATDLPAPTETSMPAPTNTPVPTSMPALTNTATPTLNPCKLPDAAEAGDVGLGFPRYPYRMASTGTVKAVVLFVDFSDVPASDLPENVFSVLSPGAADFFKAVSYGRMDFALEPYFVWLRMSKPSTGYGMEDGKISFDDQRNFMQEAIELADPEVDFSKAAAVYVIANPQASAIPYGPAFSAYPEAGITVDGNTINNGVTSGVDMLDWGYLWLNHEVGHTMGLVDLYVYSYDPANYDLTHRQVGGFDFMGFISGNAPEPLAYERWQLGWLDDEQITCQETSDETVTLSAIEIPGGTKAVMVPTGTTSVVVVESRRSLGYDNKLVKPGALVYTIDTSIFSGEGPGQVFPALENDPYRDQSPLAVGESVTIGNVTITVVEATDEGDTVRVTVAK
jgi:M6 family metalloprotease-like protein